MSQAAPQSEPAGAGLGRGPWSCLAGAVGLLALVGVLGDSAATPGLGPGTPSPPWDLAAHPPAWLVTVLLAAGYGLGAVGVLTGLRAVAAGRRPAAGAVVLAGLVAVGVLTMVPPVGSADHLSYLAYGRIAAAGDDPYAVPPIEWRSGLDPVAGAVQPPWQHTPSVYGPVGTAVQAAVAIGGAGSLRLTVWLWQALCGAAFLSVAVLLDRLASPDPGRRARAAVLWTLNPLLLGQLVLGAHLDVLAVALGLGAVALTGRAVTPTRSPLGDILPFGAALIFGDALPFGVALTAGLLLGAAVGTKVTYVLFGLAALWGLRHSPRRRVVQVVVVGGLAALAVLVPAHLWAGPHVFDQLRQASRFTSLATPWRAVANLGDLAFGAGALRPFIAPTALLLAAALVVPLWRRAAALSAGTRAARDPASASAVADAARAALVLTTAWALTAPYALPWYDAMVWAPLALVGPSVLDRLLLTRLTVLAIAYVPGRVVELTPAVERITLGIRSILAPVLMLAVIVAVVRWTLRHPLRS